MVVGEALQLKKLELDGQMGDAASLVRQKRRCRCKPWRLAGPERMGRVKLERQWKVKRVRKKL